MIVDTGIRALSVIKDDPSAVLVSPEVRQVAALPSQAEGAACRALVELRRFHGGMIAHALIGGKYEPGKEQLLIGVVAGGGHAEIKRTCRSEIGSRKLYPRLPSDYAECVLGGLARTARLGPGIVIVDRAGFDPVWTSPIIVELAAEILGKVLSHSGDVDAEQLRAWLEELP